MSTATGWDLVAERRVAFADHLAEPRGVLPTQQGLPAELVASSLPTEVPHAEELAGRIVSVPERHLWDQADELLDRIAQGIEIVEGRP